VKPSDSDIIAINQLMNLWGHILDYREYDRFDELFTEDAVYDGSIFGFEPQSGLEAIRSSLSSGEHALAHLATNLVVSEGEGDEATAISKAVGLMPENMVVTATYRDKLRKTPAGWRISSRILSTHGT
jgi:SnoaL-like domain